MAKLPSLFLIHGTIPCGPVILLISSLSICTCTVTLTMNGLILSPFCNHDRTYFYVFFIACFYFGGRGGWGGGIILNGFQKHNLSCIYSWLSCMVSLSLLFFQLQCLRGLSLSCSSVWCSLFLVCAYAVLSISPLAQAEIPSGVSTGTFCKLVWIFVSNGPSEGHLLPSPNQTVLARSQDLEGQIWSIRFCFPYLRKIFWCLELSTSI